MGLFAYQNDRVCLTLLLCLPQLIIEKGPGSYSTCDSRNFIREARKVNDTGGVPTAKELRDDRSEGVRFSVPQVEKESQPRTDAILRNFVIAIAVWLARIKI